MITTTLITSFLLITPMIDDNIKDNSIIENKIELNFKNLTLKQKDIYSDIFKELNSYKDLKPNWDGYNGKKPSDEIINTAKKFLEKLQNSQISSPEIMLSGSGEIAIYWENRDNYIEVNFDMKDYLSFFYKIEENIYGEDDLKADNLPTKLKDSFKYFEITIDTQNYFSIIQDVA